METVTTAPALRRAIAAFRTAGARIGLVPTMGALHEGHLALVRLARTHADRVVASVFVNPTQFGPGEDLAAYPRQPARDAELLAAAGADLLFLPAVETIYPPGHVTRVVLEGPPAVGMEADKRPGHFTGVATVVTQLFHLVTPDLAVFGEKDAQQLAVVRRVVADLHLPIEIVGAPTVREPDGLALSSRNAYLSPPERAAATVLSRALGAAREMIRSGERRADRVRRLIGRVVAEEPLAELDYAEVVDAVGFVPVAEIRGPVTLPLAVRVGRAALIDNVTVEPPESGPTWRAER